MTRTARTYAAFVLLVAAFAALAALLMPAPAQAATVTHVAVHHGAHGGTNVGPTLAILDAAAPAGEHLTAAQAGEALLAADRVCEGMHDGVPLMDVQDAVAAQQGLSDEQARVFVLTAHRELCPAF